MGEFFNHSYYPEVEQGGVVWKQLREECDLTSTEIAPACGVGKYTSRTKLLRKKLGLIAKLTKHSVYMELGNYWEPIIATAFSDLIAPHKLEKYGFVSANFGDNYHIGGSPDRVFYDDDGELHLVEIKYSTKPITAIDPQFALQMLTCAKLLDAKYVHLVCWSNSQLAGDFMELNHWELGFEPELWTDFVAPMLVDYFKALKRKQVTMVCATKKRRLQKALVSHMYNRNESMENRKRRKVQ